MHTMQTPMVSIKAVELLYTPRLSDQIQWERTADSRLPPGDLEFVLADRTAPPRKPPKTKKKKPGKDDNSWGGIRYARLTLKNSKVTITDLGYTSKLGDRISVNFKGLGGCGRPHTLQDGDVIEFPARARTSAERVDNAEAQNITVRVKFLLELEKDGPIIWHFMPEPSTSPEELASLASSAHSAPIKSEGRTRKGRAALKILTSPLPEGVVTSPVPPSATTPARTEPSTPQARPPLRPGLYRNSGTPSASVPPLEHTGGAFQSSPSSLRKWPIGNTAGSETDWTSSSSSSLFSRSSLVLSSPSPPTTPDESPEQSRAPSPESRKPTVGRAMRSRVTSSETFLRPTRETRRTSRPIRARSPSAEAGSPSPTVNVTRPPIIASVDGRTPTFVFDGEPVPSISGRQAKPLKAGAGQRGSKNDKPPRTGVEFVREKSDEGANIIEMKAEKIPSSDHDFRLVGPFYTETKRGPIDEYCYARLTLKPSKVTIARIGSCIRLQSKSHSFEFRETGQTHPLEDGDMITFQASQDNRNPISFKVNFLTRPVPADCPIRFLSKSTQDSVLRHPPSQLGKAPSASPVFTGRDGPESKVDIETDETHTELVERTELPWTDDLRLGYGFDALTGESRARTVFDNPKMGEPSRTKQKNRRDFSYLEWQTVEEWHNKVQISGGAAVNLPPVDVGLHAKLAKKLSKHATTSTILVHCTIDVTYTPEYIPQHLQLGRGLHKLKPEVFRPVYGDYYVSGYQRGYSCHIVVVFNAGEEKVTKSLGLKAQASLQDYVEGEVDVDKSQTAVKKFSVLDLIVEADGCDPGIDTFSHDLSNFKTALSRLDVSEIDGVPRVAYLYHYSALSFTLSRRVNAPSNMFLRARQLWDMYTHLQTRLLHPALPESGPDYSVIKHALADFRSCRRLLVQTGGQKKPIDIDHLQERLEFANNMADTFIRRYKFIRTLMAANRITPDPPWETDNGWVRYGWKCGTPAGSVRVDSEPSRSDDTSQEIFELEWSSPPIQGTMRRSQRDMTFFSTPRGRDPGGPPTKNAGGFRGFFNRAKKETGEGTFTFYLWNHEPVYIVGWSILGYCQGEPRMPKVAHKFHNILSDKLTITVDTTRVTDRWVCRVAFVKQSSYNFPHLELSGRG